MMDYSTVLLKNYLGTKWKMEDATDYDTLEWYDETSKPSKDDLDTKLTELQNAEPYRLLREERNRLIAETDWTQGRDIILSNDTDWKTYRQALRDLPAKSNPKLNSMGELDMTSITWPTKPTS